MYGYWILMEGIRRSLFTIDMILLVCFCFFFKLIL